MTLCAMLMITMIQVMKISLCKLIPLWLWHHQKIKLRTKAAGQSDLLQLACHYLGKSEDESEVKVAKVWASKLKALKSDRKLLAEKFINDIFFKAQLGTLNRNSVKINEFGDCNCPIYSPALQPRSSFESSSSSSNNEQPEPSLTQLQPLNTLCTASAKKNLVINNIYA